MTDITETEAWKRGTDRAKRDMAEARPKLPDPLERGKAIMAEANYRRPR